MILSMEFATVATLLKFVESIKTSKLIAIKSEKLIPIWSQFYFKREKQVGQPFGKTEYHDIKMK
jgi:hypothetical protein